MRTFNLLACVSLGGLALAAGPARAQFYPQPQQRPPALSPYINLARPGLAGINYYGLVRPQLNFQNSLQRLQNQVTTVEQQQLQEAAADQQYASTIAPTGQQVAQFQTHTRYFLNNGSAALPLRNPALRRFTNFGQVPQGTTAPPRRR